MSKIKGWDMTARVVSRPYGQIRDTSNIPDEGCVVTWTWRRGAVWTEHGFVMVSARWSHYRRKAWPNGIGTLSMIVGGVEYSRELWKFYSQRYLVTLAARFAAEVAEIAGRATS